MCRVYVLCCLMAAAVASKIDPHVLELKQHYEHVSYIAAFPCHAPQPRVFPVHQLFPAEQRHGKAYYPDVTVLHDCGSVGSCTSAHHCVAVHSVPVKLPFKITFLQDMEGHEKGSWLMEYHELLNHTECGCAAIPRETPVPGCGSSVSQTGNGGSVLGGYGGGHLSSPQGGSVSQTGYGGNVPESGYGGSQLSSSQGGSDSQSGYGGNMPASGYGGSQLSSSQGGSDSQTGYGGSVPASGYGGSQLSSPYGGSGGSDTSYTSIGFRLGDSSGEDNSTSTTTEAADVKTNQLNDTDTLTFNDNK